MRNIIRGLVFLSLGYCSLSLAEMFLTQSTTYCNDCKCLNCHRDDCIIVSTIDTSTVPLDAFSKSVHPLSEPLPSVPYTPTLDVAQYLLQQGNARSANLIEGFIPLYHNRCRVHYPLSIFAFIIPIARQSKVIST